MFGRFLELVLCALHGGWVELSFAFLYALKASFHIVDWKNTVGPGWCHDQDGRLQWRLSDFKAGLEMAINQRLMIIADMLGAVMSCCTNGLQAMTEWCKIYSASRFPPFSLQTAVGPGEWVGQAVISLSRLQRPSSMENYSDGSIEFACALAD